MDEMMGGYADPPIQRQIHPRGIKPEATAIAEANKGDGMRVVLEDYASLDIHEPTGPKVHGAEAKEYADRNHGQVGVHSHTFRKVMADMVVLMHVHILEDFMFGILCNHK